MNPKHVHEVRADFEASMLFKGPSAIAAGMSGEMSDPPLVRRCLFDIEKAYPKVDREALWQLPLEWGSPHEFPAASQGTTRSHCRSM